MLDVENAEKIMNETSAVVYDELSDLEEVAEFDIIEWMSVRAN